MNEEKHPGLDGLVAFHGHLCPGLAIGYRATRAALERLGVERARDEELVAIVENDSCSVDAAQYLAGTTFGKGNLFFRDWGKQVFTFGRRGEPGAIRVALKWDALPPSTAGAAGSGGTTAAPTPEEEQRQAAVWRQEKIEYILNAPLDDLFDVRKVTIELPPRARILRSVRCDHCGEPVMETRTCKQDGRTLCAECAQEG